MCDHHNIDKRITPPREGEQYFINAKSLSDSDCEGINHFIKICRNYVEIKKLQEVHQKQESDK